VNPVIIVGEPADEIAEAWHDFSSLALRHPDVHVAVTSCRLAESYGEAVDLTLYRCIQEGITNAIRHGKAKAVSIDLAAIEAPRRNGGRRERAKLVLDLSDDGMGMPQSTPKGFGLTAMTERTRSLGGSCMIESAPKKGTRIHVEIPVERGAKERARRSELVGSLS
jgi:two-component system sensor histidine kinase UhpB